MYGFQHIPREEAAILRSFLDKGDLGVKSTYWARYAALGIDAQARLGYALARVMDDFLGDFSSPQQRAYGRFLKTIPSFAEPFSWIGWAGERGSIGPAYRIDPLCFPKREPVLFYTDNELACGEGDANCPQTSEELASAIVQQSSGLEYSGTGTFESIHGWKGTTNYLTFRLDFSAVKDEIQINGKTRAPEHICDGFVLVLQKTGEYLCALGEVVPKASGCDDFISQDGRFTLIELTTNSYCMK